MTLNKIEKVMLADEVKNRIDKIDGIESSLADIATQKIALFRDVDSNNKAGKKIEIDNLRTKQIIQYAEFYRKLRTGTAVTIACLGDSMTYGTDDTSVDKLPPDPTVLPNGSTHYATRATKQYPSSMAGFLKSVYGDANITVINRGFSGDNTYSSLNRWITPANSDLTIIMLGINDSQTYSATKTISEFIKYYEQLIIRELLWNSAVVLLTPPKQRTANDNQIDSFGNAVHLLGAKYNIPVISGDEMMSNYPKTIYSDDWHFNGTGYEIFGAKVASLFIGEGCHKPNTVRNGTILLTRKAIDNVYYNNAVTYTTNTVADTPNEFGSYGIAATIGVAGKLVYSFYTEEDNLLVSFNTYIPSGANIKAYLDFNVMQSEYSMDTTIGGVSGVIGNTANAQLTFTPTSDLTLRKADAVSYNLLIPNKGWHTLTFESVSSYMQLYGIEFIGYESLFKKTYYNAGLYPQWSASPPAITTTRVKLKELDVAFRFPYSTKTTSYFNDTPLKLTIYNHDQSILQYIFTLGTLNGDGRFFQSTPTKINIATTPTDERTCTGITVDTNTLELVINWGGNTSRLTSFNITAA